MSVTILFTSLLFLLPLFWIQYRDYKKIEYPKLNIIRNIHIFSFIGIVLLGLAWGIIDSENTIMIEKILRFLVILVFLGLSIYGSILIGKKKGIFAGIKEFLLQIVTMYVYLAVVGFVTLWLFMALNSVAEGSGIVFAIFSLVFFAIITFISSGVWFSAKKIKSVMSHKTEGKE